MPNVGVNVSAKDMLERIRRDCAVRRRRTAARVGHSRPRIEGHPLRHGVSAAAESAWWRATTWIGPDPGDRQDTSSSSAAAIPVPIAWARRIGTRRQCASVRDHAAASGRASPVHAVAAVAADAAPGKLARRRRRARVRRQHDEFEGDAKGNVKKLHAVRVGPAPKFEPIPGTEGCSMPTWCCSPWASRVR